MAYAVAETLTGVALGLLYNTLSGPLLPSFFIHHTSNSTILSIRLLSELRIMSWLKLRRYTSVCTIHSQGLSLLPSSINEPFLPYLSSGYEPGSQGIFIEEAFYCTYCTLSFVDLTYRHQVCRPLPVARGTTKCNMALLRIPRIHQRATKCCLIPFNS